MNGEQVVRDIMAAMPALVFYQWGEPDGREVQIRRTMLCTVPNVGEVVVIKDEHFVVRERRWEIGPNVYSDVVVHIRVSPKQ